MLESLSFEGTTKVINKGVDVALIISPENAEEALRAAKICGVCGVSTAVLSVTETNPIDTRTLTHFVKTVGRLVFANPLLLDAAACTLQNDTVTTLAAEKTAKAFSDAVFWIKKQERGTK